MAIVDGYDVVYAHRGSWKAKRSHGGQLIDVVPVAWDRDYTPGKPPKLIIWFKDADEASLLLQEGDRFVAALSRKRPAGASSNDIRRLFVVEPLKIVPPDPKTGSGLLCNVVAIVPPPS